MSIHDSFSKYRNDPVFRKLADTIRDALINNIISIEDVRKAVSIGILSFEESTGIEEMATSILGETKSEHAMLYHTGE